ncbi:hypothetical protein K8I31_22195 [bacterium]|nr:hypothetical protein [bacterium]
MICRTTSNKPQRRGVLLSRRGRRGFTFPEVLAAMVFTAIVIPTALQGIAIANRAAVYSQRQAIAIRLAEQVLNETIINQTWQTGRNEGTFDEHYPNFHWKLVTENWQEDNMTVLTVAVYFPLQGQERHIRLSALVDDEELNEETE